MGTMPHLKIAALLASAPTDPEAHLDPARVERYARMLDDLPPVFDTPEGLLLADGYHRLAAARRSLPRAPSVPPHIHPTA